MIKILAASALALGFATSAFAQTGTGSSSDGGAPGGQPVAPAIEGNSSTSSGSTQSTPAAGSDATNSGVQGSSGAGSNENCPPETPGAGTKAPSQSAEKNPACTD